MSDFLIIGGGIAGISAGARLSALGHVTVLEREDALAYHASGRSAALFEENYGKASVIALNRASRAYLETAHGGVLSPRGLMLAGSAAQAEAFADELVQMNLDEISGAEARAICPILRADVIDRAGYSADARDIDTDRLVQNFAREIRAAGGKIVTKAEVTAIRRHATGWAVTAGGETYEGKTLVNAAGAWVDVIAQMAGIAPLGFTPNRRSMARIPLPAGLDPQPWPMVFAAQEAWYFKPDAGALIVSPAEEHPMAPHDAWADDMVLAEGLARFEEATTVEVTRLLASWAGLRTFSPDRQLVLGPDPSDTGFVWVAGQGGYGFQTSPAASQLVADLVAGRASDLDPATIRALDPARLRR